jgi:hypothetical protein
LPEGGCHQPSPLSASAEQCLQGFSLLKKSAALQPGAR